ncbi:MAG: hypothetical protein OXC30_00025 [Alphaproteobacteria bacterium]|nr:hypothetical protein [Alphaproteobacteria bacterium]
MTYILLFLLCFHLHGSLNTTDDRCSDDPCDHAIEVSKRRHGKQFLREWNAALLRKNSKECLALYPINYQNLEFQPLHDLTAKLRAGLAIRLKNHHLLTAEQILALTATKLVTDYPSIRAMNCTDFENMHSSQLNLDTFPEIASCPLDLECFFYLFSELEIVYDSVITATARVRSMGFARSLEPQYNAACQQLLKSFYIFCDTGPFYAQDKFVSYPYSMLKRLWMTSM